MVRDQYYSVKVFLMGIQVVETRGIASLQGFAFRVIISALAVLGQRYAWAVTHHL